MKYAAFIAAAVTITAGTASAQFTGVRAPRAGEANHAEILSRALGGTFDRVEKRDYTNGSITASRMHDRKRDNDRIWDAGTYHVETIAHEAGYTHTIGVIAGEGRNFDNFENVVRSNELGSQQTVSVDSEFRWALKVDPQFGGNLFTSRGHDNADCVDHQVSYRLANSNGDLFGYALFFEDIYGGGDRDYNDAAVLLTIVPTPQAAMLGFAGIGGLGVFGGRRRRTVS